MVNPSSDSSLDSFPAPQSPNDGTCYCLIGSEGEALLPLRSPPILVGVPNPRLRGVRMIAIPHLPEPGSSFRAPGRSNVAWNRRFPGPSRGRHTEPSPRLYEMAWNSPPSLEGESHER